MSRVLEGIQELPWAIHALVAVGLASGLILWLAGQRLLKPLVVIMIALVGGLTGGLGVPFTSWGESLTHWHGMGIGTVAGLLVGLLLYRSAMAVGFGVVLGALLPLTAATVLSYYPISESSVAAAVPEGAGWVEAAEAEGWEESGAVVPVRWQGQRGDEVEVVVRTDRKDQIPENLRPAAERIGEWWASATARLGDMWNELPSAHRAVVALCAAVGVATGVITGLILPGWASASVTAMFGAAVWLPCFVWLSNAMGAPWRAFLDRSAAQWLAVWGVAALLGLAVQWWTGGAKKGKKTAPAGG